MSKKLLSFVLILCMLIQAFGVVSFASDEILTDEIIAENEALLEDEALIEDESVIELMASSGKFRKYFVNDEFTTGLDGWVYGPRIAREGSLSWDEAGGYMVLSRTDDTADTANTDTLVKADRDFDDVPLEGNKIVIETKVKVTGNASNNSYACLRFNVPTNGTYVYWYSTYVNYLGSCGSILAGFDTGSSIVQYKKLTDRRTELMPGVDFDNWINTEIIIDGTDGNTTDYTITAWQNADKSDAVTQTGTLNELNKGFYDPEVCHDQGFDYVTATQHTLLKALNFTLSNYTSSITVDYIRGYYERDYIDASASVAPTVSPAGSVTVNFTGGNIPAFPEDVVTIDGVECDVTTDVAAQTVTLTPKSRLTPGSTLTVNVDDALLFDSAGVALQGSNSFPVSVEFGSATAELISDSVIAANDSVTVKFTSTEPMTSFADGLVTIEGVECSYSSDAANKTVTLTPKAPLTAGQTYTVKVDTELLQISEGSILSGPSTFNFSVIPLSIFDVKFDKKPMPDTTVSVEYQYAGVNNEGAHTYQWQTADDEEGPWTNLPNGTGKTYTFDESLAHGAYIRATMTPFDELGNQGNAVTTAPVMYKITPSEDEDGVAFRKYYINDDYNTAGNVGNWKVGETAAVAGQTVTVTQENLEENGETVGAMKFYAAKNASNYLTNQQPYIDNDFTDIDFKSNSKIVIETRVKSMGGFYGITDTVGTWSALTFNRPNQAKYLVETSEINFRGHNGGTLFMIKHDLTDADAGRHISGLRYKNGSNGNYTDSSLTDGNFLNKWVNVKIVLDGTDSDLQNYTITVTDDDGLNITKSNGILKEHTAAMYDVPSAVDNYNYNAKSMHTDIRNLSFVLRNFADTVYVDYFKLYEVRPAETVTISLPYGTTIRPSDSVTVKFEGSSDIEEFAEGLVTIDGVECDVTSDVAAQTVTLTPKQRLSPAATYTLGVNSKVLASSEGFILNGTKEFTLNTTDVNVYDVVTTGRTVPGTVMGVEYTYADSLAEEGAHRYQWQKSDDGISWVNIDGQTASTYTVTQDIFDNENYVRAVMTPVDVNGRAGLATEGSFVLPEITPVLEGVQTNTALLFPNTYLTPVYNYIDPNGDRIVTKAVNWYSADSAEGPWTLASTEENYYITQDDIGKYFRYDIKVINDAAVKKESTVYESGFVGPVADIVESTNKLTNPGFERGDLIGWKTDAGIIEIAGKEGAKNGDYAVHLMPRDAQSDSWAQTVSGLVPGKSYILSCWVKTSNPDLPNVTNFWPYAWSGVASVGTDDYSYLVGNDWLQATRAFKATATSASVDFLSFHSMNADCYIDDTYFGELIISDIETFTPDATEIPAEGVVKLSVTSGKVLNQMGTTHGLTTEDVKIRVPEGVSGITQEGNNIVIDNSALAGIYTVEIYCEPSFGDPAQNIFQKFINVELLANNDKTPKARNVKATGTVKSGSTLKGTFEYYQIDGIAGNSTVKWVFSDSYDGEYTDIPGAISDTYTVEPQYADKFIKFAVLPATVDGVTGTLTYSNALTNPRAPFATDVKVTGDFKVGGTLAASYTHNDYNEGDEADTPVYQWYASSYPESGFTPIAGATDATYTLTENEIDKYIKVGVTAVSKVEPTTGAEVQSTYYYGPTAPTAENVSIIRNGNTLTGSYEYNHTGGARETDTIYKWTVNGTVVSNKIYYTINFTGSAYVEFSVTPVGDTNPSKGKTYSVGAYFDGNLENSGGTVPGGSPVGGVVGGTVGGGGGAGGGGGSVGSTGVTSINDMKMPETEKKEPEDTKPESDIDGHWGEAYIKEMETRGVMKADSNGNYAPDKVVSRAEMITYLFDALKLEESEYNAEFSDVSADDDFAGKLQAMIDNGTIASYHEFRPNDEISREEMCKILYVSLENAGKLIKAETNVLDVFTDKELISDWAIDYVNTIYSNKIMIGTSDTTFAPTENITTAQVATMLVRILEVIEG